MAALLSILSSLLVGIVLVFAPWTPLWDSNWLLQLWPALRGFLLSSFTRGAVTGLGLVNVLLALGDVHRSLVASGAPRSEATPLGGEGEPGDRPRVRGERRP